MATVVLAAPSPRPPGEPPAKNRGGPVPGDEEWGAASGLRIGTVSASVEGTQKPVSGREVLLRQMPRSRERDALGDALRERLLPRSL